MTAYATATPETAPARGSVRAAGPRGVAAALAIVAVLAGCGLRLETPAPTEPVPDADEIVRETAVDDALAVSTLVADVTPTVDDEKTLAVLAQADAFAVEHVAALGGVYDSGLPEPGSSASSSTPRPAVTTTTPDPSGDTTQDGEGAGEPAPDDETGEEGGAEVDDEVTTDDVVTALVEASQRTRASADATSDGQLARLLVSVAASEHVSARRLAAVTRSDAAKGLGTAASVVDEAPAGVSAADLAALVAAEDAAGYAYEVRAAQTDGSSREAAVVRAAEHRARAESWALAAGTDGTDQDPRRVAYVLPDDDLAVLAQGLETDLATSYATLVATATQRSRAVPAALLTDAWSSAVSWGAEPVPFPGLPEQAGG
ncbi:DUF4439 domain-containing protein [Cellulosimicrobium terreum]|nr:DUF4439 domain-containing protein [Cellulosimicrobium terreum]